MNKCVMLRNDIFIHVSNCKVGMVWQNGLVKSAASVSLFLVACAVLFSLSFGSISHAFLPHEHSHEVGLVDLMHSALRHEDKQLFVPFFLTIYATLLAALLAAFGSGRQQMIFETVAKTSSGEILMLRNGTAKYRRFR